MHKKISTFLPISYPYNLNPYFIFLTFDGDPIELTKAIVDAIGADKVCIAGSIGNEERMNQMKDAGVAEYTMGSALFNANFVEGGTFRENLEYVLNYLSK